MRSEKPGKKMRILLIISICVVAFGLIFVWLVNRPSKIAKVTFDGNQVTLYGHISWDNYCQLTTIRIASGTLKKTYNVDLGKSFYDHCLNGTGMAKFNWFNIADNNNDGHKDIGIISGYSGEQNEPTYKYLLFNPNNNVFN